MKRVVRPVFELAAGHSETVKRVASQMGALELSILTSKTGQIGCRTGLVRQTRVRAFRQGCKPTRHALLSRKLTAAVAAHDHVFWSCRIGFGQRLRRPHEFARLSVASTPYGAICVQRISAATAADCSDVTAAVAPSTVPSVVGPALYRVVACHS